MPIYEYQCDSCKTTFEKLIFKGDQEQTKCPKCDSPRVKRILSAASFMAGSGIGGCVPGSPGGFS